jgi:hypothetical protein
MSQTCVSVFMMIPPIIPPLLESSNRILVLGDVNLCLVVRIAAIDHISRKVALRERTRISEANGREQKDASNAIHG